MADHQVRIRSWVRGSDEDVRNGLIGYLSVFVGNLIVDGITLRKTSTGRLTLSFPERQSRSGHRHAVVRPIDDHARREIEAVILGQLLPNEKAGSATEDS